MQQHIGQFHKTNHFMLRQWFRGIEDSFLEKLVPQMKSVTPTEDGKNALIVSQKCLAKMQKQGIEIPKIDKHKHLIIVWEAHLLITVYISKDENDFDLLRRLKGCRTLIC
jgi:hypothetical protein